MKSALDVITFGEAVLLLVADCPGPLEDAELLHKRTAGAETNVAIGLARLGLKVGWASRLSTDTMGVTSRKPCWQRALIVRGWLWTRLAPQASCARAVSVNVVTHW